MSRQFLSRIVANLSYLMPKVSLNCLHVPQNEAAHQKTEIFQWLFLKMCKKFPQIFVSYCIDGDVGYAMPTFHLWKRGEYTVVLHTPFMVAIARLTSQKGGIIKCKHLLGCRGKMKLRVSQHDKDLLKNTKQYYVSTSRDQSINMLSSYFQNLHYFENEREINIFPHVSDGFWP